MLRPSRSKVIRDAVGLLCSWTGASTWMARRWSDVPVLRVLMYHDVPSGAMTSFQRQIDRVIRKHRIVSPDDLSDLQPGINVLITFDDGFESSVTAARYLEALGRRAVLFVPASILFFKTVLDARLFAVRRLSYKSECNPRFLQLDALRQLAANGHVIGSHTFDHVSLSDVPHLDWRHQVIDAKAYLSAVTGQCIDWFAFPYGRRVSVSVPAVAFVTAHHQYLCSAIRGLNALSPRQLILRDNVDPSWRPELVEAIVSGGLDRAYRREATQVQRESFVVANTSRYTVA